MELIIGYIERTVNMEKDWIDLEKAMDKAGFKTAAVGDNKFAILSKHFEYIPCKKAKVKK